MSDIEHANREQSMARDAYLRHQRAANDLALEHGKDAEIERLTRQLAGAVERVIADDEAMRRARRAYLNSAPHGTQHDDAARLEHMRAAFRAAFGEQ